MAQALTHSSLVSKHPVIFTFVALSSVTLLALGILGHLHIVKGLNNVASYSFMGLGGASLIATLIVSCRTVNQEAKEKPSPNISDNEVECEPPRGSLMETESIDFPLIELNRLFARLKEPGLTQVGTTSYRNDPIIEGTKTKYIAYKFAGHPEKSFPLFYKPGSTSYLEKLTPDRAINTLLTVILLGSTANQIINKKEDAQPVYDAIIGFLKSKNIDASVKMANNSHQVRITIKKEPKDLVICFPFQETNASRIFGTIIRNIFPN